MCDEWTNLIESRDTVAQLRHVQRLLDEVAVTTSDADRKEIVEELSGMVAQRIETMSERHAIRWDAECGCWATTLSDGSVVRQVDKTVLESFLDYNDNRIAALPRG